MATILIVEDQSSMRLTLTMLLKKAGHRIVQAQTREEASAKLAADPCDLVITDLNLREEGDGLEVLQKTRAYSPQIEVIVLTAYGSLESAVTAMRLGAFDYISKPFEPDELLMQVDKALERQHLKAEVRRLRHEVEARYGFGNIVAHSKEMHSVLDLVRRVAPTDATVLIQGESGTGKELIARAVHENSARRDLPFIPLNCGALPEALLESELFGHVKGAFTGAIANKKGLFEEAHQGTLFLDEIGEMSLPTQVRLLRVLQNGEIRHLGGNLPVIVDVRVLAATNRKLEEAVREKTFREDLYYRLQVIPLFVPPLRDRRDDILPIAEHFLQQFAKKFGKPLKGISREAQRALQRHDWPGNVRELENAIERATILCAGKQLLPDDLDLDAVKSVAVVDEDLTLAEAERRHLAKTRDKYADLAAAAKALGVTKATLQKKLKAHGL